MTVLSNSEISNIPFVLLNAEGKAVPLPSGAASIDQASAGTVALGADNASVDFTPSQPPSAADEGVDVNITMTVTNADGSVVTFSSPYTVGTAPAPDTKVVSGSFTDAGITTRPLS